MTVTDDRLRQMTGLHRGTSHPFSDDSLPPGPRLPGLLQTILMFRFRHQFVPAMHRRYGDVFTVRVVPRGTRMVLFSRPDDIREIFAGDPAEFHAGKGNAILGPVMGEHSVLLVDGEVHQRARKLLMPAFNGAALRGYRDLVTEVAAAEVRGWQPDTTFRSLDAMNRLTLEVILRVVFGVTDEQRLAALRPRVNRTVDISPTILLGWAFPRLLRFGRWRAMVDNQRELDSLIFAEITERRSAPDLDERTDVLSRLLQVRDDAGRGLSDAELRDQLVTLLLAGHETTATGLAWALYELGRDPALLTRAQRAADEGDDAFLEAVFKESLRLHPVIPMVVRYLMAPARIGGRDFPAGVNLAPSIILSHASPDAYPDPDRFSPDRFLGTNPPPLTWIPFGGGVRRCLGAGFSIMEGVVVLREVLASYDVKSVADDEPRVRNITSVPQRGAPIRVTRRG